MNDPSARLLVSPREWIEENRDFPWDMLRLYVGVCLFIKGCVYLRNATGLVSTMHDAGLASASPALAHWVAVSHMAGGLLLAFGLFTRLAALVQLPNVAGAVFLVHWKDGLFTPGQTLEFATLVLVLLALFAMAGAGRWSIDHHFSPRNASPEPATRGA